MATPVFSLSAEILTDAPFEVVVARLREPGSIACIQALGVDINAHEQGGGLHLDWSRTRMGSQESGLIRVLPHERGAHLTLEARQRGWTSFATFGMLRWKTDQLLERLVEEL